MRKILLLLVILAFAFAFASCGGGEVPEQPEIPDDPGTTETPDEPETPACKHDYVEIARTEAMPLADGVVISECTLCKEQKSDVHPPMTRKLKILAIGNSHSENAVQDLWNVCSSAGVTNLVIGNAVIGGSGLDDHAAAILYGNSSYIYRKFTGDEKKNVSVENVKIDRALLDEEWDYVIIQQRSQYVEDARFTLLDKVIEIINKKCPKAEIYWHITWSYENIEAFGSQSIKNEFINKFGGDSKVMCEAILASVEKHIVPNESITGIIPAGTALQNLRTSYVGETLTRDGVHTKAGMARFTVALTWYAYLTGGALDKVTWLPTSADQSNEISSNYDVIYESVENALENPYKITQSKNLEK